MIPTPAQVPFRPQSPREESTWFGLWPEKREALQLAWLELLPMVRATARRNRPGRYVR